MTLANTLIGDDSYMPDDATERVSAEPGLAVSGDGLNVSRGVAVLLLLAVAFIALIRYAGLQAMIAVGRG